MGTEAPRGGHYRYAGSVQCSVKQQAVWRRTEDHRDEQTCVLPGSHYPWRLMTFHKILVAFDGSEAAQRGLTTALALASDQQATLFVLNVVDGMPTRWCAYVLDVLWLGAGRSAIAGLARVWPKAAGRGVSGCRPAWAGDEGSADRRTRMIGGRCDIGERRQKSALESWCLAPMAGKGCPDLLWAAPPKACCATLMCRSCSSVRRKATSTEQERNSGRCGRRPARGTSNQIRSGNASARTAFGHGHRPQTVADPHD